MIRQESRRTEVDWNSEMNSEIIVVCVRVSTTDLKKIFYLDQWFPCFFLKELGAASSTKSLLISSYFLTYFLFLPLLFKVEHFLVDITAQCLEKCPSRSKSQVAIFSKQKSFKLTSGNKPMYSIFKKFDAVQQPRTCRGHCLRNEKFCMVLPPKRNQQPGDLYRKIRLLPL